MHSSLVRWLCCLCLVVAVCGIKNTLKERTAGVFAKYVVDTFGMAVGGKIKVNYNIQPTNEALNTESYVLIVVLSYDQTDGWYSQVGNKDLSVSAVSTMCQQPSMYRRRAIGSGSFEIDVTPDLGENRYSVAVLQCYEGDENNPINVHVTAELLNARPHSDEYSHMPIDKVMEVRVLEGEMIIYALLFCGMLGQIYAAKVYARKIHTLFLIALGAVFLSVTLRYSLLYRFNKTGVDSDPLTIAVNIFNTFANLFLLASLLMLSLGWTLVRAVLHDKEWQLIFGALGAYLTFGLAGDVCITDSPTCVALNLIPFILQSLIMLGIIIAMNFTVTQLRVMVNNSPWVPSTPLQYARHKQYHVFRLVFLLYLILPTMFLVFEVVVLSWRQNWINFVLTEMLDIAMVFHVGVTFSPLNEQLMIRAFDGSGGTGIQPAVPGEEGGDQEPQVPGAVGGMALPMVVGEEAH